MKEKLKIVFDNYKIKYTENMLEMFEKYFKLVLSWNEKINLTSITNEDEFITKHFLDCAFASEKYLENTKLVDVGSGAGFPGIVLKILRPDLDITLIDSLNKRINFLNTVIEELKLTKIKAIHTRSEDFANNFVYREKFDYAVARAVANLSTLSEYLLPLVKIGGKMIAYKSQNADEEIFNSKNAISTLGGGDLIKYNYIIKEISATRIIIALTKTKHTPNIYPRGKNKPKEQPL